LRCGGGEEEKAGTFETWTGGFISSFLCYFFLLSRFKLLLPLFIQSALRHSIHLNDFNHCFDISMSDVNEWCGEISCVVLLFSRFLFLLMWTSHIKTTQLCQPPVCALVLSRHDAFDCIGFVDVMARSWEQPLSLSFFVCVYVVKFRMPNTEIELIETDFLLDGALIDW
jgi:hypothetical protein